jgi:hypothetical protein
MNISTLVIATLCVLAIAYRCYGLLLPSRMLGLRARYIASPAWITAGHRLSTVRSLRSRSASRRRVSARDWGMAGPRPAAAHRS